MLRPSIPIRPSSICLTLLVTALAAGPTTAAGQAGAASSALTGTWEVALEARGRAGTPEVLSLTQNPDGSLTGAFVVQSLRREEAIADGRVVGASFSFTRTRDGGLFEGVVEGDRISGTVTLGSGRRTISQEFTGARTSAEVLTVAAPPTPTGVSTEAAGPIGLPSRPAQAARGATAQGSRSAARGRSGPISIPVSPVGEATISVDGETRTIALTGCSVSAHRIAGRLVEASADGLLVNVAVADTAHSVIVFLAPDRYTATYNRAAGAWTRMLPLPGEAVPAEGPLATVDGPSWTARGTFTSMVRGGTEEHELEVRVLCQA